MIDISRSSRSVSRFSQNLVISWFYELHTSSACRPKLQDAPAERASRLQQMNHGYINEVMDLAEWLEGQPRGAVSALSRSSGISMLTIRRVRDGMRLRSVTVAEKLSAATDGAVPVSVLIGLSMASGSRAAS